MKKILILLILIGCRGKCPECPPPPPEPKRQIWGVLQQQDDTDSTKATIRNTPIDVVRCALYWHDQTTPRSNVIDDYLENGYAVQINYNWKPTSTPVGFPTDEAEINAKAHLFFAYYKKWNDVGLIPVVVVENEWDNLQWLNGHYHTGTIAEYLNELKIITRIGHKYGFKIADAGFTGNNLQRWTYSQLTGDSALWWKQRYFLGLDNQYEDMLNAVEDFAAGIKTIDIDYLNMHWYNRDESFGGYRIAAEKYIQYCGKSANINNEFGIKLKEHNFFFQTANEVKGTGAALMIVYSGIDAPEQAVKIPDDFYKSLLK